MPGPVGRWLATFMCKHYADTFEAFGFKTLQSVCQLQLHQLQSMGVAQEHCDLILENVFVLRQTLSASSSAGSSKPHSESVYSSSASTALRSVAMNRNYQRGSTQNYQEDYHQYGPNRNQIPAHMEYQKPYDTTMASGISDMTPRDYGHVPTYTEQSHGHMMIPQQQQQQHQQQQQQQQMTPQSTQQQQQQQMTPQSTQQQQQQQMTPQSNMYQQQNHSQSYVSHNQHFGNQMYPSSYVPQNTSPSNVSGNYYNSGQSMPSQQSQQQQHPHGRQMQNSINPQAVADNILQMASSFPSSQTVQVPLNKNRHAPYHIPQASHNYSGTSMSVSNPNQMTMSQQHRMYPNPMNTGHPQASRTSPISPMPLQSPVSHHSNQSIASPASLHSPSSVGVRSPAQSPGGGMRSPCGMQSMASPHGQPMKSPSHVQMGYSQQINSPSQRNSNMKSPMNMQHYSPNSVSQASSPYSSANRTVQSPQSTLGMTASGSYVNEIASNSYINETSPEVMPPSGNPTNPLQSLQKLVMLPETRVIDPKSVVNDACVPSSPQNTENSKNCDSSAEWLNRDCSCSAGSTYHSSPDENRPISNCTDNKTCFETCDEVTVPLVECHNDKEPSRAVHSKDVYRVTEMNLNNVSKFNNAKTHVDKMNSNLEGSEIEKMNYESTKMSNVPLPNGISKTKALDGDTKQKLSPPKKKILTAYNESLQENYQQKSVTQSKTDVYGMNGLVHESVTDVIEISKDSSTGKSDSVEINSSARLGTDNDDVFPVRNNHTTKIDPILNPKLQELSAPKVTSSVSENNSEESEEELHVRKDNTNTYSRVRLVRNMSSSSYGSVEKMRNWSGDEEDCDGDGTCTTNSVIIDQKRKCLSNEASEDGSMSKKFKIEEPIEIIDSFDEDDEKPLKCVQNRNDGIPTFSAPQLNRLFKLEADSDLSVHEANVSVILKTENSSPSTTKLSKKKVRPKKYTKKGKLSNSKVDIKLENKKKTVRSSKETLKDMKLGKTLSLMKNTKKKSDPLQNVTPFVRLVGSKTEPSSVIVYNNHPQDEEDNKQKKTKGPVSSTLQISNLPSDKSVMLPHSQTLSESNWVCALCGKRSSFKFLGDLFGPYYLDSHIPLVKKQLEDESQKDKVKTPKSVPERKRRKSSNDKHSLEVAEKPLEVWVHEICVLWSDGVFLLGCKIYGLEEAIRVAGFSTCSCCKESGAMIGCLHKGCTQKYHFICAAESKCYLDEDNFSLLCVKHKRKKAMSQEISSSKS